MLVEPSVEQESRDSSPSAEEEQARNPPFLPGGNVEPHAGLLTMPPADQLLYKVMRTEHLLASIEGSYLHFNRVDSYKDFPGADTSDGEQLPADHSGNAGASFEKEPEFTLADYYDRSRSRTYACCFSLENTDHIWENYGNGGTAGKVALVFRLDRLREMLNAPITACNAALIYDGLRCHQIFDINYGVVEYIDRNMQRANEERAPNPIQYIYMKHKDYHPDTELRVSLSAIGMGHFALADGSRIEFPPHLRFGFDYRAALASGAIEQILRSPDCDPDFLEAQLARFRIVPKN